MYEFPTPARIRWSGMTTRKMAKGLTMALALTGCFPMATTAQPERLDIATKPGEEATASTALQDAGSRLGFDCRHEPTTADPGRLFCSNWSNLPRGQIGGNVEIYLERSEAGFTVEIVADSSRQACAVLAMIRDRMTTEIEPARVTYRGGACIKRS